MHLKSIKYLFFFFFAISIVLTSCEIEPPEPDVNNDTTDSRGKFHGTWTCKEKSSEFGESNYEVDIEIDTNNTARIFIYNIYQLGFAYSAFASTNDKTFSIPSQTVSNNTIEGSGELIFDDRIDISFTVDDGSTIDSVTATLTK